MPAFREDTAAVINTMFIIASAPLIPSEPKKVTNGLTPAEYAVWGSSIANSNTEPT
ncbi:hypothetical protein D3C87_1872770 [compost metagenome]